MPVKKPEAAAARPRADDAKPRLAWNDLSAGLLADLKGRYLEGAGSYAELVEASGLGRFEFQNLVKNKKWGPRPEKKKSGGRPARRLVKAEKVPSSPQPPASGEEAAPARSRKRKLTPTPIGLVKHAYSTIEKEFDKLERQEGTKSQDRERASRALSQIMNSLEKAVEMEREIAKDKKGGDSKQVKEVLKDAEAKRKELAERIARFRASRAL